MMSKFTADQRKTFNYYRRTYVRDNYRCIYCGRDMISSLDDWLSLEVDHLIARKKVKAGKDPHEDDNLVTSCNVCNKLKSNYHPEGVVPDDPEKQIEIMREYVLEKRMAEQLRWLKALRQFDDFKEHHILKDDSNIERSPATKPLEI